MLNSKKRLLKKFICAIANLFQSSSIWFSCPPSRSHYLHIEPVIKLFESLAFGIKVYFNSNHYIYKYNDASHVLEEFLTTIPTIDWLENLTNNFSAKYPNTNGYIDKYIFNLGNSTEVFIQNLIDIDKK